MSIYANSQENNVSAGMKRALADIERRKQMKLKLKDNPNLSNRPAGWQKPPFNTDEYRMELAYNRISYEEFEIDQHNYTIRRKRALAGLKGEGRAPTKRELNPKPWKSRQYANHMSTEAARDTRLVPMARVALQWIVAKGGRALEASVTKHSLANALGVSVRSAQRYISSLRQFGYVETEVRMNHRGLHTGLIIRVTKKVLPFWKDDSQLSNWLEEEGTQPESFDWTASKQPKSIGIDRETGMSPKNYNKNNFHYMKQFLPLVISMNLQKQRI